MFLAVYFYFWIYRRSEEVFRMDFKRLIINLPSQLFFFFFASGIMFFNMLYNLRKLYK